MLLQTCLSHAVSVDALPVIKILTYDSLREEYELVWLHFCSGTSFPWKHSDRFDNMNSENMICMQYAPKYASKESG